MGLAGLVGAAGQEELDHLHDLVVGEHQLARIAGRLELGQALAQQDQQEAVGVRQRSSPDDTGKSVLALRGVSGPQVGVALVVVDNNLESYDGEVVTDGALVTHQVVPGVGLLVHDALHEADGADRHGALGGDTAGGDTVPDGMVGGAGSGGGHRRVTSTRGIVARMCLPASWYSITVSSCSWVVTSRSSSSSAR